MLSDHLKTCESCRNEYYSRIRGSKSIPMFQTKGASEVVAAARARKPRPIEREVKLRKLGK